MTKKSLNACVRLAIATALALAVALPAAAQAQAPPTAAMDGRWHFVVAPYMWFTGIKGSASVGGLPEVPVEASFSDIFKDLSFALAGHFEGRKNRFGFGTDLMYTDLSSPVAANSPVVGTLGLKAGVKQLFTEGFGLYRVATGGPAKNPANLDLLVGVRYTGTSTQLTADTSTGNQYAGQKKDLDWVDAMAGIRATVPLGSRVAFMGRGDVAGFGTKLTWNLEGDLATQVSDHWVLAAGWRHMHIDYDEGSGRDRKLFDIGYDGPRAWFAYAW